MVSCLPAADKSAAAVKARHPTRLKAMEMLTEFRNRVYDILTSSRVYTRLGMGERARLEQALSLDTLREAAAVDEE